MVEHSATAQTPYVGLPMVVRDAVSVGEVQKRATQRQRAVEQHNFGETTLKAYEAAGFEAVTRELKFYKEY